MKKVLPIVFAVLAVVLVGGVGFQLYRKLGRKEGAARQRAGAAVGVEVSPVELRVMKDVGDFFGSLTPRAQFVVAPKIAGRLEKLHVDVGDSVRRGDLIAEIDDEEAAQQVEQARAELEVARAGLADAQNSLLLAERDYERVKILGEKQIASLSEVDLSEAEYKAAEARLRVSLAQVQQKEAALKATEVRRSYTVIRAEWNTGEGSRVIGERFANEGALLKANDPIVSVLDIDVLVAVIQVIERDYPRIREGQRAVVTSDLFPAREFEGRIARIAPLLKEEARQSDAEVEVENPGRILKPGMFVRVRVEYSSSERTPAVPVGALVRRNGGQGVFLVEEDGESVRFVPVRVGVSYEGFAAVLDPPLSGLVVTLGNHLLENGARIRVSGSMGDPQSGGADQAPSTGANSGERHTASERNAR